MELKQYRIDGIPLEVDDAFKNAMKSIINENKMFLSLDQSEREKRFFKNTL